MPSVHALKKTVVAIAVLAALTAVSYIMIFGRQEILSIFTVTTARVPQVFKFVIALLMGLVLLGLLIGLRRVVPIIASTARYLWAATPAPSYDALEPKERIAAENGLRANQIQVITAAVQALGGIAVLIGIYFAWANLKTTQEAQKDTQKTQAETLRLTNEGQITERFTKAIDQLGATDNQGQPRLELRLGGIYALERIAQESEEDHWPIMEVLTTYVRVHAPVKKTQDKQLSSNSEKPGTNNAVRPAFPPIGALSPDIQAILTVIGRREHRFEQGKNEILDLSNTNLAKADLRGADLRGANLKDAQLSGADLRGAYLPGANLDSAKLPGADLRRAYLLDANLNSAKLPDANLNRAKLPDANLNRAFLNRAFLNRASLIGAFLGGANLGGADLRGANLNAADLPGAKLPGANLPGAKLPGANLRGADLPGANLRGAFLGGAFLPGARLPYADLRGANLEGAILRGANLDLANLNDADLRGADMPRAFLAGANLNRANLNRANLNRANLCGAHLTAISALGISDAVGLTQEQLNSARGDKDTELPHGLVMPKSWKQEARAPNSALSKSP